MDALARRSDHRQEKEERNMNNKLDVASKYNAAFDITAEDRDIFQKVWREAIVEMVESGVEIE